MAVSQNPQPVHPPIFSPPPTIFFKDGQDPSTQPTPSPSVEDWDPDQVATWMRETGWDDKIVAGFHDQNLDGRLLLFLTDSALERVYGIMDETLRKVMIQNVDELRNSMHSQPSTSDGVRVRPVVKTQSEMAPPPYVAQEFDTVVESLFCIYIPNLHRKNRIGWDSISFVCDDLNGLHCIDFNVRALYPKTTSRDVKLIYYKNKRVYISTLHRHDYTTSTSPIVLLRISRLNQST
ncbi:hypothetical protein BC829DRAFT_112002 [Chytridium lagenaria]|nr:hypothetical protein BC829DRAFT_112002 [Chytridium lagenaria]